MSLFDRWRPSIASLMIFGVAAGTVAPIIAEAPAFAQSRFTDVPSDHWAKDFIESLAAQGIIAGFPDGTFRPNTPVTRAQFAAMLQQAFDRPAIRNPVSFLDVPAGSWAAPAINEAYATGFMTGYPGNVFNPSQNIPRVQVLVALANGLNYTPSNLSALQIYADAEAIPDYARNSIAAATDKRLVVNYPSLQFLNPNQLATRAEVAAFIYQALVSTGQVAAINSPYIIGGAPPAGQTRLAVPAGTTIPAAYSAERILVLPDETAPLVLTIPQNITSESGQLLIPAGTSVVGVLQPAEGGSQFVSTELVMKNGTRIPMQAVSRVVTDTRTIQKGVSTVSLIAGAAVGSGAAAAIAGVTGDRRIDVLEVLGGTAAGTLAGLFLGRKRVEVVEVNPETDLNLRLIRDLVLPME